MVAMSHRSLVSCLVIMSVTQCGLEAACEAAIGNTHSCLLLYYILAEEELFSLVAVEINVHDNASIVRLLRLIVRLLLTVSYTHLTLQTIYSV